MDHYLEIKAKPNEEISPEIIISKAFSVCHLAMVKLNSHNIGVSFPQADATIGTIMRLHGAKESLDVLAHECANLADYCQISSCRKTPINCKWRIVKRVQPTTSSAKIRRLVKRGSITTEEAEKRLATLSVLSYPYVQLRSGSTNQSFRLFISQQAVNTPSTSSPFNSYGLGGPVPWF